MSVEEKLAALLAEVNAKGGTIIVVPRGAVHGLATIVGVDMDVGDIILGAAIARVSLENFAAMIPGGDGEACVDQVASWIRDHPAVSFAGLSSSLPPGRGGAGGRLPEGGPCG